jgi:hypothetical protein
MASKISLFQSWPKRFCEEANERENWERGEKNHALGPEGTREHRGIGYTDTRWEEENKIYLCSVITKIAAEAMYTNNSRNETPNLKSKR